MKKILDACCGGRMMWFDKQNSSTIFIDSRRLLNANFPEHPNFKVDPDFIMDFRKMKFKDNSFNLVVFDPPHLSSLKKTSWMAKKYGVLDKKNWKSDIKKGFDECWRVLKPDGILIFKWSVAESRPSNSISAREVIKVIGRDPLFGHPTGNTLKTIWLTFMKN